MERQLRLDAGLRGWIIKTARKNYWRVQRWYDLDDLVQDGFLCFSRAAIKYKEKYPHVHHQGSFVAYVKNTYMNHINDLANSATKERNASIEFAKDVDSQQALERLATAEPEEATLASVLQRLPKEVRRLPELLLQNARVISFPDGRRETNNQFYCRLLGCDPDKIDVEKIFREHLAIGDEVAA